MTRIFKVFLSSGDDALLMRDEVSTFVDHSVNGVLRDTGAAVRFEVERWEETPAQRNPSGEAGNAKFVRKAQAADVTLTLLVERLGDGTREELDGVLDETDKELSALWYVERTAWPACDVASWLDQRREDIHFDRIGPPGAPENAHGLFRVFLRLVLQAVQQGPSDYSEER